jgi:HEAT repeat protein
MKLDDVRAFVEPDEPDYAGAALALGPDALPFLAELAAGNDPMLASKAVYLAGLIGGDDATPILERAAEHHDPVVRVALAATIQNVDDNLTFDMARRLLGDPDLGVRRHTVMAASHIESAELRARLRSTVEANDDEFIRSMVPELDD